MSNPYSAPQPSGPSALPDIRPLHKRKRVWAAALALLVVGGCMGSAGGDDSTEAAPAPSVTETVTATPEPAPTVTVTETATASPEPEPETATPEAEEDADDNSGSQASGGDNSDSSGSGGSSTTTGGGGGGGSVYYANCSEARAAGAAPIYRGEPGYASHLDRDKDGVACDS